MSSILIFSLTLISNETISCRTKVNKKRIEFRTRWPQHLLLSLPTTNFWVSDPPRWPEPPSHESSGTKRRRRSFLSAEERQEGESVTLLAVARGGHLRPHPSASACACRSSCNTKKLPLCLVTKGKGKIVFALCGFVFIKIPLCQGSCNKYHDSDSKQRSVGVGAKLVASNCRLTETGWHVHTHTRSLSLSRRRSL